jgi:hypothetical protein
MALAKLDTRKQPLAESASKFKISAVKIIWLAVDANQG